MYFMHIEYFCGRTDYVVMKRVGIASFHVAINYGVYLQAYALQEKVRELGYSPEIIDYRKRTDEKYGKIRRIFERIFVNHISIYEYIKSRRKRAKISGEVGIQRREKEFLRFADQYFSLTKQYDSYDNVLLDNGRYDACICGSDQIWNPDYTKCNPFYFLEFVEPNKRIAYAPSIAVNKMTEQQETILMKKMSEFAFLSIRENTSALYWSSKIGRKVLNAIDPTLLFPSDFWRRLAIAPNEEKPYLLCYFLGHSELYLELIRLIKEKYELDVVILPFSYEAVTEYVGSKIYASIEEFLGYFENASFILTDSFHGTAFAVNYNIDFYTIKRQDNGNKMHKRVYDFLKKINLESRIVNDKYMITDLEICRIDYKEPNQIIDKWRKESCDFLHTSLESVFYNSAIGGIEQ